MIGYLRAKEIQKLLLIAAIPTILLASQATAGHAKITITRPTEYGNALISATVKLNGVKIADLDHGQSYVGTVATGPAVLSVSSWTSPGESKYSLKIQPGGSYRFVVSNRTESFVAGLVGGLVGQALEGGGLFKIEPAR
jgi:hypothetical protein